MNIYEKNPNFKGKPSFKKWCNYCRRYGHTIAECRQKQQDNQNKPQKHKEPNKSFYQYMKKDQNLPNKNIHSKNSSGKPLPINSNYSRNQSPYNSSYRGRSPEQRNSRNSHKIDTVDQIVKIISTEINIHDQIQTEQKFLIPVSIQILGIDTIQTIDHEIHHIKETETIQIIGIEVIQTIEINVTKTIDQEIIHTIDLTIKETIIITIIGHETTHKIEIPITTIEGIILNLFIETIIATLIPNTNIEKTHRNISDKLFKYKQMEKQLQIPLVLTIQKVPNYN